MRSLSSSFGAALTPADGDSVERHDETADPRSYSGNRAPGTFGASGRSYRCRQAAARDGPTGEPRCVEASQGPSGSVGVARGLRRRAHARTHADPLRTHAAIAVHVLPRFCQCHGVRSVDGAGYRRPRPGLRRLPSAQLRRIRHARTEHRLRHQRLRRDLAGALGMGRQTAGCLVRPGRAGQWPVGSDRAR